jgi:hypothetical protein
MIKLRGLVMSLALLANGIGCATVPVALAIASAVVSVMSQLATSATTWEKAYFSEHPDTAKQAEIERAIATFQAADATAGNVIATVGDLSSGQVEQAVAEAIAAYEEVQTLLKDLGVMAVPMGSGVGLQAPLAGRLYLPAAEGLIPRGVNVEHVKTRAQAVRAARARARDNALIDSYGLPIAERGDDGDTRPATTFAKVDDPREGGVAGTVPLGAVVALGDSASPAKPALPEGGIVVGHAWVLARGGTPNLTVDSDVLPQWLAVPVVLGLATR